MIAFYKVGVEKGHGLIANMVFRAKEANVSEILKCKDLLDASPILPESIELLWKGDNPSGLIDTIRYSFVQIKEFGQAGFLLLDHDYVTGVNDFDVNRAYEMKSIIRTLKEKLERLDMMVDAAFSCYGEGEDLDKTKLVNEIAVKP